MSAIVVALLAGGVFGYFLGAARRVERGVVTRPPDYLVAEDQFGDPITVETSMVGPIVVSPSNDITVGAIVAVWTRGNGTEARVEMPMEGAVFPLKLKAGDSATFHIPATLPQLSEYPA